ncbi:MAG: serD [Bacteroidetes bacterium]|nr:serD [Bacteroidota bacterium]
MDSASIDTRIDVARTRSAMYSFLSKSLLYPTREVVVAIHGLTEELGLLNATDPEVENVRLFLQREGSVEVLESEYNRLFAHLGSAKCPPYETEYGYDNVFQKTQAMADIAGFYTAFGLEVGSSNTERVDFISTEFEFMSYLALHEVYACEHGEAEHLEVCSEAQRKFVQDHVGRWVSIFSQVLLNATTNPFYLWLARRVSEFTDDECRLLCVSPDRVAGPNRAEASSPEPFDCSMCLCEPTKRDKVNGGG